MVAKCTSAGEFTGRRIIGSHPDIFKLQLLTFVFESLHKLAPHYFHSYFSLNSSIHSYETRHSTRGDIYVVEKNTLQFGLRSIRYMGAKLWNDLPLEVRNSTSKFLFKRKLKLYLQDTM